MNIFSSPNGEELANANVVLADDLIGIKSGGSTHFENESDIHIHADVLIVADDGIGELISGIEDIES